MKKFKFYASTSSDEDSNNSNASDDEIPDLNVPSQIKISEPLLINIDQLSNKNSRSDTPPVNDQPNSAKSSETDSHADDKKYKSFLAERTKQLLEAFSSDSEEETSKDDKNNITNSISSTTSSGYENNNNNITNSATSESDENEISKREISTKKIHEDQNKNHAYSPPATTFHLKVQEVAVGRRQQKLLSSIKKIYDFFDHKIPVQSIICAIHDHAGMLKETVATLNKYPTKYDNYSLHDMPSHANQSLINNYLRIYS